MNRRLLPIAALTLCLGTAYPMSAQAQTASKVTYKINVASFGNAFGGADPTRVLDYAGESWVSKAGEHRWPVPGSVGFPRQRWPQ